MKVLTLILATLLSSAAVAQPNPHPGYYQLPVNPQTKKVEYTAVVPVANASKDELFVRAQEWLSDLASTHTLTKSVKNPETGMLVAHVTKGNNMLAAKAFRLTIHARDGQYHYIIDRITHTQSDYARAGKYSVGTVTNNIEAYGLRRQSKSLTKVITEIDTWIQSTIADLDISMRRPEAVSASAEAS